LYFSIFDTGSLLNLVELMSGYDELGLKCTNVSSTIKPHGLINLQFMADFPCINKIS
jgi:hypothetical protein